MILSSDFHLTGVSMYPTRSTRLGQDGEREGLGGVEGGVGGVLREGCGEGRGRGVPPA